MASSEVLGIVLLVIGAAVAVSEIHTLTIYLIAVAVACFAAAGVALAGGGLTLSLVVLAAVVAAGLPVAHWVRGRMRNRASEEVSHDDVGRTVTVIQADDGGLRVSYRGSTWHARLADPSAPAPQAGQTRTIAAREGSTLVLDSTQPHA